MNSCSSSRILFIIWEKNFSESIICQRNYTNYLLMHFPFPRAPKVEHQFSSVPILFKLWKTFQNVVCRFPAILTDQNESAYMLQPYTEIRWNSLASFSAIDRNTLETVKLPQTAAVAPLPFPLRQSSQSSPLPRVRLLPSSATTCTY